MHNFVECVFVLTLYLNRRRVFFDLRRQSVLWVEFEKGDMAGVPYGYSVW